MRTSSWKFPFSPGTRGANVFVLPHLLPVLPKYLVRPDRATSTATSILQPLRATHLTLRTRYAFHPERWPSG